MLRDAGEMPDSPIGSTKIACLHSDARFEVDSSTVAKKEDWIMQRFHSALKNTRMIGRAHIIYPVDAVPDADHCDADVHRSPLL